MGQVTRPSSVLLVLAAFSRHQEALEWAKKRAQDHWGALSLASPLFEFRETDYYRVTMGDGLKKVFYAFADLADPASLAACKLQANAWEEHYGVQSAHAEDRPLNLDPGYITESKLVLASTKNHAHRIYLSDGVYAEITLRFKSRQWAHQPWTYPDYRRSDYHAFFTECRDYLRARQRSHHTLDG